MLGRLMTSIVGNGVVWVLRSASTQPMPSRGSAAVRIRPVGPPPTPSTGMQMVCVIAKTPRGCPSVAHRD